MFGPSPNAIGTARAQSRELVRENPQMKFSSGCFCASGRGSPSLEVSMSYPTGLASAISRSMREANSSGSMISW